MAQELRLPELGENIETVQVAKVLVSVGDTIEVEQPILELETDKATMDLPSSVSGLVEELRVEQGREISVGDVLLTVRPAGDTEPAAPPEKEPEPPAPVEAPETGGRATEPEKAVHAPATQDPLPVVPAARVPAAPSVRRFAREIGIDLSSVSGSGNAGRVSVEDVKAYAKKQNEGAGVGPASAAARFPSLPDFSKWGPVEQEPMSMIRRKTGEHLTRCWTLIPHVTQFDRADITELETLRKRYAGRAEKVGGKLTMAVMVCKIAASALKMFPKFNASIDMEKREVVLKQYVNLGIAVSSERGLLVPVIPDADKKNMVEIAADVSRIAARARTGEITLEEMQGGTFTVTNLGSIGGTHFTPIVNHPEVAILGMGRAYVEAGFVEGQCVPRTILPLSLSYDHRLIDGAEGARFLRWIVEAIEQPLLLSLEG
ncbi:MAG: 2-oxo acid dehydrogenase subunit E2 [Lentisphaerae bacterium]|nr:2-oxo acid dehydrogenase subunit E2 [Lentisphaerota bacterium]